MLNSLIDLGHAPFLLAKNQIKLMSKKQRLEFYARLYEKQYKTTKPTTLYVRVFIKTMLKTNRAKIYKNLNEKFKKNYLRDNPDWKNDITMHY